MFPRFYLPSISRGAVALPELLGTAPKLLYPKTTQTRASCAHPSTATGTHSKSKAFLWAGAVTSAMYNQWISLPWSDMSGRHLTCCTSTYSPSILCRISHTLPARTGLTAYIQIIYIQRPTVQAPHCTWLQSSALAIPHKSMAAVISQVGESQLWQQSTTKAALHIANTFTFYTADFPTSYGRNLLFLSIWATFWSIFWRKLCFLLTLLLKHLL